MVANLSILERTTQGGGAFTGSIAPGASATIDVAIPTDTVIRSHAVAILDESSGGHTVAGGSLRAEAAAKNANGVCTLLDAVTGSSNPINSTTAALLPLDMAADAALLHTGTPPSIAWSISTTNLRLTLTNPASASGTFDYAVWVDSWIAGGPPYLQSIDMSFAAGSYSDLTYARTGQNIVVATSASAAQILAAGVPLFEDRGDGVEFGVWSFPPFQNDATQDLTTWATIHTATITALAAGTAPDGTSVSYEVNDTDAANVAGAQVSVSGSSSRIQSIWVRDHAATPPTAPGMLGSNIANVGVSFGTGTTWRRVSYADNGFGSVIAVQVLPAGAQPGGSFIPSATGAVDVAFPSSVAEAIPNPPFGGTADYPTVVGTGATNASLLAPNFLKIVSPEGDFDIDGKCAVMFGCGDSEFPADKYLFFADTPDGELSLRFTEQAPGGLNAGFILCVRGVDIGNINRIGFQTGDDLVWRTWYRPSTSSWGIRVAVNGVYVEKLGTAVGPALSQPTAAKLGSDTSDSNNFAAMHSLFQASAIAHVPPTGSGADWEFLVIGDSISTGYPYDTDLYGFIYVRDVLRRDKAGFFNQAAGGATINMQKATFDASPYKGLASIRGILIQVGINDIINEVIDFPTWVTRYQALVNDVASAFPGVPILGCKLLPCRAYMVSLGIESTQYPVWLAVNAAIGDGTITGLTAVVSSQVATMNDGSGNLAAPYNSGDNLHPDQLGKQVFGAADRATMVSLGLIP